MRAVGFGQAQVVAVDQRIRSRKQDFLRLLLSCQQPGFSSLCIAVVELVPGTAGLDRSRRKRRSKRQQAGCHAGPLRCMARCPMQTAAGAAEWVSPTPFNFSAPRLWFSPSARMQFLKQRLITRARCLVEIGSQPWDIVNTPTGKHSEFDRRPAKPSHQDSQAVLVHGPHVPGSKLRAA